MSNLFAMLNTGVSGVIAAQVQLDVNGHNIANLNNKNYSRQRVELASSHVLTAQNGTFGTGVKTVAVVRVYDEILARTLRSETSSLSYWANNQSGLEAIRVHFDEMELGSGLGEALKSYFDAWQELSSIPADKSDESYIKRTQVLASAEQLCLQIKDDRAMFSRLKNEINEKIRASITEINTIGESIAKLNEKIASVEADGSHANDLRDTRDALLSTLSINTGIDVVERPNGMIGVYIAGEPLVDGHRAFKFETLERKDGSGDLDIVWRASITDQNPTILTNRISGGTLQSNINLRDTIIDKYISELDSLSRTIIYETNKVHVSGQGLERFVNLTATNKVENPKQKLSTIYGELPYPLQAGTFQIKTYNSNGEPDSVINVEIDPSVDTLNGVAEKISVAAGNAQLEAFVDVEGYLRVSVKGGYTFSFGGDTSGFLVAAGLNNFFTGTDSQSIGVDSHIKNNVAYIATSESGDVGDNRVSLKIADIKFSSLSYGSVAGVSPMNGVTIDDFYSYFTGLIATEKQQVDIFTLTKQMSVESFELKLEEVRGVSETEETANMIMYQKILQANSRFVNAVDEMLNTIVNNMGLVGR